jgi:ankyrin repeat protein
MTDEQPPMLTDDELAFLESVFDLAREGETAKLTALIEGGVPVNLTNARGDTLLILAAYRQHADTVDALLRLGADTARVNDNGQTALVSAVFRNNAQIVTALLAAGADPNLGAHTALAVARQFDLPEMEALFADN